ncbi:MAG: NADH-quinone oxidoreductase subunit H [Elusimicrobiota bacterium]|nr:NADH-quinone oxidoreductase subunit H [Elusimicrobiota bacterium]
MSYITPLLLTTYNFLIFPGFLFIALCGIFASFIDRKVTARVQWRRGPPLLQPLYDLVKLLGKETIVPAGVSTIQFLLLPLISVSSVVLLGTMRGVAIMWAAEPFIGDLIVSIYLMTIPAICIILAASISKNPLASIGASREMKLILAYEVPFVLALIVPIIKSGGKIVITEITQYQVATTPVIFNLSGIIAFLIAIICLQAKLGLVPFDISEAEQEIMSGTLIEYSGFPLAAFKLSRMMMLFVYPLFLIKLFWYSSSGSTLVDVIFFGLKYLLILVIMILIRNTNPRVRIEQVIKFFWSYGLVVGIIAVVSALVGL